MCAELLGLLLNSPNRLERASSPQERGLPLGSLLSSFHRDGKCSPALLTGEEIFRLLTNEF